MCICVMCIIIYINSMSRLLKFVARTYGVTNCFTTRNRNDGFLLARI